MPATTTTTGDGTLARAAPDAVRELGFVAIGFGVLTLQRLQVRRRDLMKRLGDPAVAERLGISPTRLDTTFDALEQRIDAVVDPIVDTVVATLEQRLPGTAGPLLGQARDVAKLARRQVRGLIRNAL